MNYLINLPYVLADDGYDVWMVNSRTIPTPRHVTYSPSDDEMWEWSFDELALMDVPAAISFILQWTNSSQIASFIGHSQGGTIGYALFTTLPEVSKQVQLFIPLAGPAGPPTNTPSIGASSQRRYLSNLELEIKRANSKLETIGMEMVEMEEMEMDRNGGELIKPPQEWKLLCTPCPDSWPLCCAGAIGIKKNETLTVDGCYLDPILCADTFCILCGCESPKNFNGSRIPVMVSHYPVWTSVQNMQHWSQLEDEGFRHFNYGEKGNLQHYNQTQPPAYYLSNISTPVAVFYGKYDKFCPPSTVQEILKLLPEERVVTSVELDYGHLDFIFGEDMGAKLFPHILSLLNNYS